MPKDIDIAKESLLEALDVLSDGIAIYGENDEPLYANRVSRRQFNSFFDSLEAGASFRDAVRPAVLAARPKAAANEIEQLVDFFHSAYVEGRSYDVVTEDGRTVRASYHPMSGNRTAALSVDITDIRVHERELKKARNEADLARKAAEAASEAKSAFLANMSHEIRTPLNGILGMAQVLEADDLTPEQRERVAIILDSGRTLMTVLNDVLDLSKIESGGMDLALAPTDVVQLLRQMRSLWLPQAEEKGLELRLSCGADVPNRLMLDSARLQQCLGNLISNAIKFTQAGRIDVDVAVRPRAPDTYVLEFRVCDTGIGIDEATIAKLFRPFAQADESITRRFGGTGLGLSITRRLAQLMGGDATVSSRLGHGSRFTLTVCGELVSQAPPQRAKPQEDATVRTLLRRQSLRILLVDDNALNRKVADMFLQPLEAVVVEASNGVEALSALQGAPFDVILLDMHMPVMDGAAAIKEIRANSHPSRGVPVIALTADAMGGDRERFLAMGFDGYQAKPLSQRDLLSEILRALSLRKPESRVAF